MVSSSDPVHSCYEATALAASLMGAGVAEGREKFAEIAETWLHTYANTF
jgi:hypothetical protein